MPTHKRWKMITGTGDIEFWKIITHFSFKQQWINNFIDETSCVTCCDESHDYSHTVMQDELRSRKNLLIALTNNKLFEDARKWYELLLVGLTFQIESELKFRTHLAIIQGFCRDFASCHLNQEIEWQLHTYFKISNMIQCVCVCNIQWFHLNVLRQQCLDVKHSKNHFRMDKSIYIRIKSFVYPIVERFGVEECEFIIYSFKIRCFCRNSFDDFMSLPSHLILFFR